APQADVKTVGAAFREAQMPESAWNLWSNGQIGFYVRIESPGKYRLVVGSAGTPAKNEWPQMAVVADGRSGRMAAVEGRTFKDYSFDVELGKGVHLVAVAFLNDLAVPGKDGTAEWAEDRNLFVSRMTLEAPADAADPVRATEREYADEQALRERALLAELDARIDKVRKSDVTVRVVDAAGRPVPGAVVEVEQVRSLFLFGCNIYRFDRFPTQEENEAYKKAFAELFNYATVAFYWRWYEPQQGKPDYAHTDKVVDWCRQRGIAMKGHPLLWADEGGIPTWSKGQPSAELQKQRVKEILGRYKGRIDRWEVVNEPGHLAGNKAINGCPELERWKGVKAPPAPRAQSLNEVVMDRTRNERAADPSDIVLDDEVEVEFRELLEKAETPEKRAALNELDDEQKREAVRLYIEQEQDQHIEDKAREGNRRLGRKA
ncbi:MAG TPA: endo-1,4-beta-xylanase, partial [Phycisphaerae bacterium]|nr:endo-1,4-beta-xylanase [Phycisphaerae bacterium]